MTKRNVAAAIVLLGLTGGLVVLGGPVLRIKDTRERSLCQSHLKQITLGVKQYNRDYDELLPLKDDVHVALGSYTKNQGLFFCPKRNYGYRYNRSVAGLWEGEIREPDRTALFYDALGAHQSNGGESWLAEGVHMGGNNVAFVDGHVKWMRKKPVFWWPEFQELHQMRVLKDLQDKDGYKPRTAAVLKRRATLQREMDRLGRVIQWRYMLERQKETLSRR